MHFVFCIATVAKVNTS